MTAAEIDVALYRLFLAAGPHQKKARELEALLAIVDRVLALGRPPGRRAPVPVVVDAASGRAPVGLLVAERLAASGRRGTVIALERDPARLAALEAARGRAEAPGVTIEARAADVGDAAAWPDEPSLVVALHACGPATDAILDAAVRARAAHVLVVPCCTSEVAPDVASARALLDALGLPRDAVLRRPALEALVDGARALRLERAGYATRLLELVPASVTPMNRLFHARRDGEPVRAGRAAEALARLGSAAARLGQHL